MPEVKKKRFFRLFKVAKELNVGSDTIVAYLQDKGHDISNSPNTKLNAEQYEILLREYASEKQLKEKAEQFIERRKEENRTYKDKSEKPAAEKEDEPISPLQLRNKILPKRKRSSDSDTDFQEPQQTPTTPSGKEPAINEEVSHDDENHQTQTQTDQESSVPGLKVVGKIDLQDVGKKKKIPNQEPAVESKKSEEVPIEDQPLETTTGEAVPNIPETKPEKAEPKPEIKSAEKIEKQVEKEHAPKAQPETPKQQAESKPEKTGTEKQKTEVATDIKDKKIQKPVDEAEEQREAVKATEGQSADKTKQKEEKAQKTNTDIASQEKEQPKKKAQEKEMTSRSGSEKRKEAQRDKPREKEKEKFTPEKAKTQEDRKPQVQTQPEQESPAESEDDSEIIRADDHTPKLSGLKVMGKIDLGGGKKSKGRTKQKSQNNKDKSKTTPDRKSEAKPDKVEKPAESKKDSGTDQASEDAKKKKRRRRKRKRKSVVQADSSGDQSASTTQQKGGKGKKEKPSKKEVDESIRQTLSQMSQGPSRNRQRLRRAKRDAEALKREKLQEQIEQESKILEVTEFITANEFANLIEVPVNEIIKKSFELGMMVSINQRLDAELISIISDEYGYEAKFIDVTEQDIEEAEIEEDDPEDLEPRTPIITVMGHVDHGKTTLLDSLRNTNVTAGEAGGITQHIGAYQVKLKSGNKVTFLDTPGHEAFTAMRARGAKVTDLVIVVIAADDAVMPQTREAINHAQAGEVPMIFAINKVDKPDADPDKIKNQLAEMNLLVEDWGGNYQSQEISALKGQGVDDLLEKVILEAELLELKANPDRPSNGTVIEARLDKGLGNVATLLIQNGTLEVGDEMVVGVHYAKVRALIDQNGKRIKKAGPSVPVQVLGLSGQPQAGDKFIVFKEEGKAKEIAQRRQELYREQQLRQTKRITLEEIGRRKAIGNFEELNVIIRADVDGSVEALSGALLKLSTEEVQVNIILKGVGAITEGDVLLASASDAVIIAFNVRPTAKARQLAEKEEIDIRTYSVIYDAINDVTDALEGLLSPEIREEIMGTAEVREVFKISKVGAVAGCYATSGKIYRNEPVRVIRDGVVIYDSNLSSLKRFKDDVKEVASGFEFGAMVENYNDIKEGDVLESYRRNEVKRKLKK